MATLTKLAMQMTTLWWRCVGNVVAQVATMVATLVTTLAIVVQCNRGAVSVVPWCCGPVLLWSRGCGAAGSVVLWRCCCLLRRRWQYDDHDDAIGCAGALGSAGAADGAGAAGSGAGNADGVGARRPWKGSIQADYLAVAMRPHGRFNARRVVIE